MSSDRPFPRRWSQEPGQPPRPEPGLPLSREGRSRPVPPGLPPALPVPQPQPMRSPSGGNLAGIPPLNPAALNPAEPIAADPGPATETDRPPVLANGEPDPWDDRDQLDPPRDLPQPRVVPPVDRSPAAGVTPGPDTVPTGSLPTEFDQAFERAFEQFVSTEPVPAQPTRPVSDPEPPVVPTSPTQPAEASPNPAPIALATATWSPGSASQMSGSIPPRLAPATAGLSRDLAGDLASGLADRSADRPKGQRQADRDRERQLAWRLTWRWRLPGANTWWFWAIVGSLGFSLLSLIAVALLLRVPALPNCPAIFWPLAPASMRLYCAEIAANKRTLKDLYEAIALVSSLPPDHELRPQVDRYLAVWTDEVLDLAEKIFEAGDLKRAIAAVDELPKSLPHQAMIAKRLATWRGIWKEAETAYNTAKQAVRDRKWDLAFGQANKLAIIANPYWASARRRELIAFILETREDDRRLQQAIALAKRGGEANFRSALQLLKDIAPNHDLHDEAQAQLSKLSNQIVAAAQRQLTAGNPDQAVALLDLIDDGANQPEGMADLKALAEAERFAAGGTASDFQSAISEASKLGRDRPLWGQAQAAIARWQREMTYAKTLEEANQLASRGDANALNAAIVEASKIPASSQKRRQANEAIARWGGQIQELRDRPRLDQGDRFAATGSLTGLQAALQEVNAIPQGSPLYDEARDRRNRWQNELERLEDEPILAQAREFGDAGEYDTAIGLAQRIGPNRALRPEAESLIRSWRAQRDQRPEPNPPATNDTADGSGTTENNSGENPDNTNSNTNETTNGTANSPGTTDNSQQLWDQAQAQAAAGDYLGAIALANRIPPNSPLYNTAQRSIAAWLTATRSAEGATNPNQPATNP